MTLVEIIINAQIHTKCFHNLLIRNNFQFEVKLHPFLSSAMDEREWLLHTVIDLPRGKNPKPPVSVEVLKSVCNAVRVSNHFKTDVHDLNNKIRFIQQ